MAIRFDARLNRRALTIRAAIHEVEPNTRVMVRLMQSWIGQVTTEIWNFVSLILLLGILATILSAAGIYGAVSFAVNQSKRELGIRVALGARSLDIVRFVFLSGGKPVINGLVIGLWLSLATAASLRKTLDTGPLRIDSADPILYIASALLLIAAATVAMVLPAHRGAGSDPVEALKCE
jgi:putative ABC transport system permease protein